MKKYLRTLPLSLGIYALLTGLSPNGDFSLVQADEPTETQEEVQKEVQEETQEEKISVPLSLSSPEQYLLEEQIEKFREQVEKYKKLETLDVMHAPQVGNAWIVDPQDSEMMIPARKRVLEIEQDYARARIAREKAFGLTPVLQSKSDSERYQEQLQIQGPHAARNDIVRARLLRDFGNTDLYSEFGMTLLDQADEMAKSSVTQATEMTKVRLAAWALEKTLENVASRGEHFPLFELSELTAAYARLGWKNKLRQSLQVLRQALEKDSSPAHLAEVEDAFSWMNLKFHEIGGVKRIGEKLEVFQELYQKNQTLPYEVVVKELKTENKETTSRGSFAETLQNLNEEISEALLNLSGEARDESGAQRGCLEGLAEVHVLPDLVAEGSPAPEASEALEAISDDSSTDYSIRRWEIRDSGSVIQIQYDPQSGDLQSVVIDPVTGEEKEKFWLATLGSVPEISFYSDEGSLVAQVDQEFAIQIDPIAGEPIQAVSIPDYKVREYFADQISLSNNPILNLLSQEGSRIRVAGQKRESQSQTSSSVKKPQTVAPTESANDNQNGIDPTSPLLPQFITIKSGRFEMGSENGDTDERPKHEVIISKDFQMGQTEITQYQWYLVMGNNPSNFKEKNHCPNSHSPSVKRLGAFVGCPNHPVEQVSWDDISGQDGFIARLNRKLGLNCGDQSTPEGRERTARTPGCYRLPTEAEWEFAARRTQGKEAGTQGIVTGDYAFGSDSNQLGQYAIFDFFSPEAVGPKRTQYNRSTGVGLYDIHGNVWEWTADWYGEYPSGSVTDPKGPQVGSYRVMRGGSCFSDSQLLRSANRNLFGADFRNLEVGFRLARTPR